MPIRLFHLFYAPAREHVRIVDGEDPGRSYPKMVLYNPPDGWEWPKRYIFRPARGDVLEIADTLDANGELLYTVPYIGGDDNDLRLLDARVYQRSTIEVTAQTANDRALEVMRLRMRDWLDRRSEWAHANGIESDYSRTSMAADVAPWFDYLGHAMALCERVGWPTPDK